MDGFQFDRHDYAKPVEPPGASVSLTRPLQLLAVVLVGLAGFVVFRLLTSGGVGDPHGDNADLAQIEQRLDAIEHRLDQAERRRKPSSLENVTSAPKDESANAHSSPPAMRTIYRISPPPEPRPGATPPSKSSPDGSQVSQQQQKELDSLRGDVVSTRQEWEATTNRLGDVVGELASQREEITRHRESLNQLAAHFQHNSFPFTLRKGAANSQRVGPLSLRLQSTDTRNQRYTMRLVVNDKVIELKDRALDEAIQFYGSGGKVLLELVVSEIRKEAVTGRLALPQTAAH